MKEYNVAIAGATGAVGEEMRKVLQQRDFPVKNLRLLASRRSVGNKRNFKGEEVAVEELSENSFSGIDIALFSAGGERSKLFAPAAVKAGAVVIDNSSAFRMEKGVPLVVPEVNPEEVKNHQGIIANPNCSTIQMVVALKPIYNRSRIKRVVAATYQAVSGTGKSAVAELEAQVRAWTAGEQLKHEVYPCQIAFNVLPHIDVFLEGDYTKEEIKMVQETQKIMGDEEIKITATCVRVPVFVSHAEAVNVETEEKITAAQARELLSKAAGIEVVDDPQANLYPLPILAAGRDEVVVGRIREDTSVKNGLNLWVVADNLRKGAALNAVQIGELLISNGALNHTVRGGG